MNTPNYVDVPKTVANRLRYARFVASTVRAQIDHIVEQITAVLQDEPEAPSAKQVRALLLMLVARIERAATTYHEARADLQREAGEDDSKRGALDQVIEEVRELLRSGRELVLRLGDESIAQRAGLIGRLPDGRDALLDRARSVRKQLKDSPWKLDGVFGTSLSSKAIMAQLDPLVESFDAALKAYTDEGRETIAARQARDEGEREFGHRLTTHALGIEAWLRLAGLDSLADRLRPSEARVRGEEVVGEEQDPA